MDKLLIKRGSKRALEQLDPLQVGELFLAKDEERLYIGGPRGNISFPTQKEVDEKATKTELQQVSLAYKESYDTLDDLKNAYPNGDVYNHVVLADGMIYTYAKGEWISTGVEANGAIEFMKAYEDLKVLGVGGRNLLRNSDFSDGDKYWSGNFTRVVKDGKNAIEMIGNNGDNLMGRGENEYFLLEPNTIYTYQVEIMVDTQIEVSNRFPLHYHIRADGSYTGGMDWITLKSSSILTPNEWHKIILQFKTKDITSPITFKPFIFNMPTGVKFWITYFKLEKGDRATDWTPAPEDIDAHPFVVELAETVFRSKQNEERIRNLEEKLMSN